MIPIRLEGKMKVLDILFYYVLRQKLNRNGRIGTTLLIKLNKIKLFLIFSPKLHIKLLYIFSKWENIYLLPHKHKSFQQIQQKMGLCQVQTQRAEFTAYFSANLKQLFEHYKKLLEYLKPSKLFSQPSQELNLLLDTYLANPKILDKQNLGLCSVDSVNKLHPLDYGTSKVTKQWLMDGCLRQDKFIQDFPYELLKFEQCYRHYVQFLYMCFKNPQSIIVPNKLADFMWHSHMQDNQKYKQDSKKMLKRVLNHTDDFTQEQMKIYAQETQKTRKRLLKKPPQASSSPSNNSSNQSYHNYAFINYGYGMCGGGYFPYDRHDKDSYNPDHHNGTHPPDHHNGTHPPDHHNGTHPPDHHNGTHPPHNDYHHNDTSNHHNDTGGHHSGGHHDTGGNHDTGGHSSCGGGHSSCGGGASSCGGGGSSCGGGCGGGGGD